MNVPPSNYNGACKPHMSDPIISFIMKVFNWQLLEATNMNCEVKIESL